jgi:hypothetical protein
MRANCKTFYYKYTLDCCRSGINLILHEAQIKLYTECSKSRFTEKPDIKTTYLVSIVLQKLFKMFAFLFDITSGTSSYAINNGEA